MLARDISLLIAAVAVHRLFGDLPGLMLKLDYLKGLGVTPLWLLPLCPSPMRDDGHDIEDYQGIHPGRGRASARRHSLYRPAMIRSP